MNSECLIWRNVRNLPNAPRTPSFIVDVPYSSNLNCSNIKTGHQRPTWAGLYRSRAIFVQPQPWQHKDGTSTSNLCPMMPAFFVDVPYSSNLNRRNTKVLFPAKKKDAIREMLQKEDRFMKKILLHKSFSFFLSFFKAFKNNQYSLLFGGPNQVFLKTLVLS